MPVLQRDSLRHTYADYLEWSRPYGDELIDGTAFVREPPSGTWQHQDIVGEIYRQATNALQGKTCRAFVSALDVRLPKANEEDDEVDTVVQPDVFIVCDLGKLDARGVRGAPDWLAEVLSPSTARYDRTVKIPVYERAGVREVWLIHPTERTLTRYMLEDGRYGPAKVCELKGRTRLTAVRGVSIDWGLLRARLP
jgi:Uma2 family endonuclease